ncbi:hypothetical protein [Aliiruegeria sabulilitoris]|uniref:hypothetical protein n=1 Tax=Aliiruegeria sabulilitoris TaxID=1510458 RepID=UPI0012E3566F|nr:hypothetical protein [Aliiruegeria sabulilitoris]NDR56307.1 hypothetical protein [Pseudoruegeria sp. M32A2M]
MATQDYTGTADEITPLSVIATPTLPPLWCSLYPILKPGESSVAIQKKKLGIENQQVERLRRQVVVLERRKQSSNILDKRNSGVKIDVVPVLGGLNTSFLVPLILFVVEKVIVGYPAALCRTDACAREIPLLFRIGDAPRNTAPALP